MESQRTATTRDFRAGVIWIWVVLFATQGCFYHHRRPLFSWFCILVCALLFTGALHFRIQRRSGLRFKEKVSNVS